jgi:hypothetical protein
MKRSKTIWLWLIAFLLTLFIAIYQRLTGPTYPLRGVENVAGQSVKYRLLRSYTAHEDLPVRLHIGDKNVTGFLSYRRYKSGDDWTQKVLIYESGALIGVIPGQPPAGKVEYRILVEHDGHKLPLRNGRSVIARFKGQVPILVLIAHVLFMFLGIMFALRTGMEILRKNGNYVWMVSWTLGIIVIGGMILGPVVQKYAFGDFWTGFPFGTDLTDNKTLIVVLSWVIAFFLKKKSKWWAFAATGIMIIMYLIPHSLFGSELDYKSGKMKNKNSQVIEYKNPPKNGVDV